MCAYLSASPNPVEFSYQKVRGGSPRTVRVAWPATVPKAKIVVSAGTVTLPVTLESTKVQDHPSGLFRATFPIRLGQTAVVSLFSGNAATPVGSVTVTTRKDAMAAYLTDPHPFVIRDLAVELGVEEVTVRFSTSIATVGWVILRRKDDPSVVHDSMGSWFQLQHSHRIPLLAQGTTYRLTVIALKSDAQGRITLGSDAGNPTVLGTVTTGMRSVHVEFNRLLVRNDSDPGGTGELSFGFGAGSVERQQLYPPAHFYDNDDLGDGQVVGLGRHVTADRASRWLWLQANGYDDDSGFRPGSGIGVAGTGPTFVLPGTSGDETDDVTTAGVTRWIDTDTLASGQRTAVDLATGDFALAYTVFSALTVTRRPGSVSLPEGPVRFRADTALHHAVAEYVATSSIDIGKTTLAGPLIRIGPVDRPTLLAADVTGAWWAQRADGWSVVTEAGMPQLARYSAESADALVLRTPAGRTLIQSVPHGTVPKIGDWMPVEDSNPMTPEPGPAVDTRPGQHRVEATPPAATLTPDESASDKRPTH